MRGVTVYVETAPHEFTANFLFNDRGLFPFFGCDKQVKRGDGSVSSTFSHDGESWQARLSYQESGIKHPGETTPQGTEFRIETLREYRLNVSKVDDEVGQLIHTLGGFTFAGHSYGGFDALFSLPTSSFLYAARHIVWTARVTSDTSATSIQDGSAAVVAASGGGWKWISGEWVLGWRSNRQLTSLLST
ncbi:MAG: hypothetical protein A07HB70_02181 [uncultured archaeon A07HB70]|nr:MAG: hypothetical protein A07HB70_02181 [uncultured archaeon A07HB70]